MGGVAANQPASKLGGYRMRSIAAGVKDQMHAENDIARAIPGRGRLRETAHSANAHMIQSSEGRT